MGAKSKREEMAEAVKSGDDGYEFKLPAFDEKAFIRREIQAARASFYTLGLGLAGGILAVLAYVAPVPWQVGWIPVVGSLVFIRPMLQKLGFSEEVTAWKSLVGSFFMAFFTGLSVWILGVNLV